MGFDGADDVFDTWAVLLGGSNFGVGCHHAMEKWASAFGDINSFPRSRTLAVAQHWSVLLCRKNSSLLWPQTQACSGHEPILFKFQILERVKRKHSKCCCKGDTADSWELLLR